MRTTVNMQVYKVTKSTLSTATIDGVPFAKAKLGQFFQDKSQLHNPYTTDGPLKRFLQRLLPADVNFL